MAVAITLTLRQARHAWLARQALLASPTPSLTPNLPNPNLPALLASLGWFPVVSGASPYLGLHARGAITRRAELDDALFGRGDLAMVPGPRGLAWVVPSAEAPLARAFAMADHASRESRVASACELNAKDLQVTRDALRRTLAAPLTIDEIRAALTPNELRPLGLVGRRAGSATLAGLVLHHMWIQGEVSRTPVDGRLDHERTRYAIDPLPKVVPSAAEAVDAATPRWLAAHAPCTAKELAQAFNIAAGRAASALKPQRPLEVAIESLPGVYLAPADFVAPEAPEELSVALLPVGDPVIDARPRLAGLATLETARALEMRHVGVGPVVLVDGEAVAAWSWDDLVGRVTIRPLVALDRRVSERIEERAVALAEFIRRELNGAAALHGPRPPRAAAPLPGEITSEM